MIYINRLSLLVKLFFCNLVDALPENNYFYRFCMRYVNRYRGENNDNILKNGEFVWLNKVLPKCEVVFDVGANVGEWAGLALNIKKTLQVHCFEPSENSYRRLISQKLDGKIFFNQIGLSKEIGETDLHIFSQEAGSNSLYVRDGLDSIQVGTEKIKMETIDFYCSRMKIEKIDFLKIDVEGHELDVLIGSSEMLSHSKIRYIQFEYGGTYIDSRTLLKDIFDLLMGYGYRMYKIHPNSLILAAKYTQNLENFQYQNWVAFK